MKVSAEFQEGDKKMNIKKVIAREGLILLAMIVLCFSYSLTYLFIKGDPGDEIVTTLVVSSLILIYPVRLLIHFIFWAIKTLKQKE